MELRVWGASAVIVQRVPAAASAWFLDWQRGINGAAETFPGYQATDVYPVTEGHGDQWAVVIHFTDDQALQTWLQSTTRAQWVTELREKIGDFDLQALPAGFGPWFSNLAQRKTNNIPPAWKMALTVLLGLYPTVMLLTIFVGPLTRPLGLAWGLLIGNALSVCLLQWVVVPALTKVLGSWLKMNAPRERARSLMIVAVLVLALLVLALAFSQLAG